MTEIEEPKKSTLREYFEALLIAMIFVNFARIFVFQAFKIPTGSMIDNLLIGDHIVPSGECTGEVICAAVHVIYPASVLGCPVVLPISGSDARNSITGGANYLIDQTNYGMSGTN